MLLTAIEAEVDDYLAARAATMDAAGRRRVVRNGHLPTRAIQTPLGDVRVQQPRVRDRRPVGERSGRRDQSTRGSISTSARPCSRGLSANGSRRCGSRSAVTAAYAYVWADVLQRPPRGHGHRSAFWC